MPTGEPNPLPYVSTPTAILNGQVTIAATPTPLAATSTPIKSVTIESPSTNAGVVYVGNNSVTIVNGYRLQKGATVSMDIDDLSKVSVVGTGADTISWIAVA
jgi:hypothetical protein